MLSFTVNVASNATGPLVNKAKVGGGGDPTNSEFARQHFNKRLFSDWYAGRLCVG